MTRFLLQRPSNLRLPSAIQDVLQELGKARIPVFASGNLNNSLQLFAAGLILRSIGSFAAFAPKVFRTYTDKLSGLFEHIPDLQRNFARSVFPTASFDFSNGRPCRVHDVHPNGSAGWVALFAGGDFDPTTGGHLYLPQVQLVIEFPPGATILIPSTLVYGIIPVPEGQTRYTFSQYIPIDVVRYIDNGYRTHKEGATTQDDTSRRLTTRTQGDLELLSCFNELHDDRMCSGLIA